MKEPILSITAVILCRNEEERISNCLNSVTWCDEIIVVDDYSTDQTIQVIESFKQKNNQVRLYQRSLKADFAGQRNFSLSKVKNKWVLFIDADEIVSSRLSKEIKQELALSNDKNINAYYLKRKDYFLGRWLNFGETSKIELIRLAKSGKGCWQGRVHEVWQIKGEFKRLKNPLLHYPHNNISSFLAEINNYSTIVAQYWIEQGRRSSCWQIVVFPLIKFISNYLLKLGFLDGSPGFIMAAMMSFHSFLVRSKVYLKQSS